MTTARDIVQDAIEMLGVYAPGETISAADLSRAMTVLNDMIDGWSNSPLATYARLEQSGVMVPGKSRYTIGPGGDLNLIRPIRIMDSPGAVYITDFEGNYYPVTVITQGAWNQIATRLVTSDIPEVLFYDPQFPLGVINIYPTPSIGYTFYFDTALPLTDMSALNAPLVMPPGYALAYKSNLAVELLPYFPQVDPRVELNVKRKASRSLADVKRSNIKTPMTGFDSSLVRKASPTYNIYTDGR